MIKILSKFYIRIKFVTIGIFIKISYFYKLLSTKESFRNNWLTSLDIIEMGIRMAYAKNMLEM